LDLLVYFGDAFWVDHQNNYSRAGLEKENCSRNDTPSVHIKDFIG